MAVKVYFESHNHAEMVAIFRNEDLYNACYPALKLAAAEDHMRITESCQEDWPEDD